MEFANGLISAKKQKKADHKEMKAKGIKRSDKAAIAAFYAAKEQAAADAKAAEEAAAKAAEEAARLEKEANPSAEDLLKEIRDLLKSKT